MNGMILGIDEAGRGPWAGPLVVGAVVLDPERPIAALDDSKKLTKKRREGLEVEIKDAALAYGLGWVEVSELDEVGMSEALRRATIRAVEAISVAYDEIIIDGTINFLKETGKGAYVTTLPKADSLIPAVSAASILAKVARDRFMTAQDEIYPEYGFAAHVGYGTQRHRDAIAAHGVTPLHRLSFAPLRRYQGESRRVSSTRPSGARAEDRVAQYLSQQGYEILERNWKTKYCEIDIIATKESRLFIVEVKYRYDDRSGDGFDAVDARKRAKLQLGARVYAAQHPLPDDGTICYLAAAVSGAECETLRLVEFE